MLRTIEKMRRRLHETRRWTFVGISVVTMMASLFGMTFTTNVVKVQDSSGADHTVLTTSDKPEDILQIVGMSTTANDQILYTGDGTKEMNITINRSFPVVVHADGKQQTIEVSEGAVADALSGLNIALEGEDFVEPSLTTALKRDLEVYVHRVEKQESTRRIEVSNDDVEAYIATLEDPSSFTRSKSRIYDATVQDTYTDGVVTDTQLLSLVRVHNPFDPPSTSFEPGVPVSTIDAFIGVEIGDDGIPTSYTRKIEGAVATAYSSSGGPGAGGQGLYCGTVAVNPNVIPYGTRMFITSADQRYVYGFAIASDTGTAMMEGYVDVDLYFESNAECNRFGKRSMDIYIFD